jgi:hypothetical protein
MYWARSVTVLKFAWWIPIHGSRNSNWTFSNQNGQTHFHLLGRKSFLLSNMQCLTKTQSLFPALPPNTSHQSLESYLGKRVSQLQAIQYHLIVISINNVFHSTQGGMEGGREGGREGRERDHTRSVTKYRILIHPWNKDNSLTQVPNMPAFQA